MSFWFAPLLDSAAAAGGTDVTATPSVGAVTLAGFAPSASAGVSATPDVGVVSVGGFAPSASASVSATPDIGAVTVTGFAPSPSVAGDVTALPGAGSVQIIGFAPGVSVGVSSTPDAGVISFDGFAPTASNGAVSAAPRGDDAFASSGARERFWARKAEEWLEEHLPELKEAAKAPKAKRKRIARAVIADVIEAPAPYRPQINAALEIARRLLAPDYTALAMQVAAELAAIEAVRTQIRRRRDMEAVLLLVA